MIGTKRRVVAACALVVFSSSATAAAQPSAGPSSAEPLRGRSAGQHGVAGRVRKERLPSDTLRKVASAALWLPRNIIDFVFRGTSKAAGVIVDRQLVPRYRELLGAPGGDLYVFPTLFVETESATSVGFRVIGDMPNLSTSQRFGYGGPEDVEVESRILYNVRGPLPLQIGVEGYYKIEDDIEYYGIGLTPEKDSRNQFVGSSMYGLYTERHTRGILSLGIRLGQNVEFLLSASLQRRRVQDTESAKSQALSRVFEPSSVAGFGSTVFVGYAELAARFDSRRLRTRPSPGVLLEGYMGGANEFEEEPVTFVRLGWRMAGFIPVYRKTNIFSPRFVFDRLVPLGGIDVPFNLLPRQSDFRGFDRRRDNLSMIASFDYTWQLIPFMGMRMFFDAATVAPSVSSLAVSQVLDARYAGGIGFDFFSRTSSLARLAVALSPEGARLLLNVGVSRGYGDRQHQD